MTVSVRKLTIVCSTSSLLRLHRLSLFVPWAYLSVITNSSATNRLVTAKDHAAVQLNVGKVDDKGRLTGEVETFALCGFIRGKGLGDDALNRLVRERGLLNDLAPAEE